MNRRKYLASLVVGSAGLSGCTSSSESSTVSSNDQQLAGKSDSAEKTRQQEEGDSYRKIGAAFKTDSGVEITVHEIRLANEIVFETGAESPGDGNMWVLAHVTTRNGGESTSALPYHSEIDLLSGNRQFSNYREDAFLSGEELQAPVEGPLYAGLDDARPQVSQQGWLLFNVPREVSTVTVSWSGTGRFSGTEAYWEQSIDSAELPDIQLTEITAPESVEIGGELTAEIVFQNQGGSIGQVESIYSISAPAQSNNEIKLARELESNETYIETISLRPRALGSVAISVDDPTTSTEIEVVPATRSLGESFQLPEGPSLTFEDLVLADSYSYESYDGTTVVDAPSGEQFLLARFAAINTTNDSVSIPGTSEIKATIVDSSYSTTASERLGEATFTAPIHGTEYTQDFAPTIAANDSIEEWVLLTVPNSTEKEDLGISAKWSFDYDSNVAVRWE